VDLVDYLINTGRLKTPRIIDAFKEIKRVDFLPQDIKILAELDEALSIGNGQTISQPTVVAFMLEELGPKPGDRMLDVGSGSGWTTALLAHIVNQKGISNSQFSTSKQQGKVIAIEIISELKEFGEKNVAKYNFIEKGIAEFVCADGSKGYKKESPFDGILASASAESIPKEWKAQLKIGGKIVAPVKESIWVITKKGEKEFKEKEYPGFIFVPLVKK